MHASSALWFLRGRQPKPERKVTEGNHWFPSICSPPKRSRRDSDLAVDLGALLHEFLRFLLHAALERLSLGESLLRRILAHVLRDLHRAEMRPTHRTEMRKLRTFLWQRLIMKFSSLVGIKTEIELVIPAKLEARF